MSVHAILLVDHGSRLDDANHLLEVVAAGVRRHLPDRLVAVAHLEIASPAIDQAVDELVARGATEIVVHPYFLAPGSHASDDVPERAARAAARHPQVRLRVTGPLGIHDGILEAVLDRIRETELG